MVSAEAPPTWDGNMHAGVFVGATTGVGVRVPPFEPVGLFPSPIHTECFLVEYGVRYA